MREMEINEAGLFIENGILKYAIPSISLFIKGCKTIFGIVELKDEGNQNIKANVFYSCMHENKTLKKLVIENCSVIGPKAFEHCSNLETVSFDNKLKRIEMMAFYGCKKLKRVVIPKSVEYIETDAFGYIDDLEIYFKGGQKQLEKITKNSNVEYSSTFGDSSVKLITELPDNFKEIEAEATGIWFIPELDKLPKEGK